MTTLHSPSTCMMCTCVAKLYIDYYTFFSINIVRKEVPFSVKRNFDILRGRYGGTFIRVFDLIKTCNLEAVKDYLFVGFKEMRGEIETIKSVDDLKGLLVRRSSFTDYTIMEDLAEFLQLADAQKFLSEYSTFRDKMYDKILAEDFAVAAIDEHIKDNQSKVSPHFNSTFVKSLNKQICYHLQIVFVVEWDDEKITLLEFQKMLRQAFQNADRFITLVAVHHSLLTFICAAPTWTVSSLILVARDSISILRELGVVKLTIGQEVILDDLIVRQYKAVLLCVLLRYAGSTQ